MNSFSSPETLWPRPTKDFDTSRGSYVVDTSVLTREEAIAEAMTQPDVACYAGAANQLEIAYEVAEAQFPHLFNPAITTEAKALPVTPDRPAQQEAVPTPRQARDISGTIYHTFSRPLQESVTLA